MNDKALERLRERRAAIAMSAAEFRTAGHRLVDEIAGRLAAVADGPVTRAESAETLRALIGADQPLPRGGADAGALLHEATAQLFEHSLFNGHPRFFGYITSSPAPIGMLADLLAAAVNANAGAWKLAPMAIEIEAQTIRWIAEFVGFPTACGGLLVSGGNVANLVCLLAARAAKAGWNVREDGVAAGPARLLVYASQEAHTWLQKAADLSGLGTSAIRWIETDARQRMNVAALRSQIARDRDAGGRPFLVVGTAGTVSTGAVDPLVEIAAVCREESLWFHVDGAYGALAAQAEDAPPDLGALAGADSIAVDPHKWLYAPLEAGCALVREPRLLRDAFSYHPAYYHFGGDEVNYVDYGPQNSRGFRALKVWLALRQVGLDGYRRMISDDIRLAKHLHQLAEVHDELEATSQELSITTFRYVPPDLKARAGSEETARYLDDLNQRLLSAIETSGQAFLSNAIVNGKFVLRACIVNFHTTLRDVESVPPLVCLLGREIDAQTRAGR